MFAIVKIGLILNNNCPLLAFVPFLCSPLVNRAGCPIGDLDWISNINIELEKWWSNPKDLSSSLMLTIWPLNTFFNRLSHHFSIFFKFTRIKTSATSNCMKNILLKCINLRIGQWMVMVSGKKNVLRNEWKKNNGWTFNRFDPLLKIQFKWILWIDFYDFYRIYRIWLDVGGQKYKRLSYILYKNIIWLLIQCNAKR